MAELEWALENRMEEGMENMRDDELGGKIQYLDNKNEWWTMTGLENDGFWRIWLNHSKV